MTAPAFSFERADTTPGTTAQFFPDYSGFPLPTPYPNICSAFMREIGDGGAADRIGVQPWISNLQVEPPAKAGGLDMYSYARWVHSIAAATDPVTYLLDTPGRWFQGFPNIPAGPGVLDVPHGLGAVPDFVSVSLATRPTNAVNWAVTAIDDVNISLKNWHATEDIWCLVYAAVPHSIENAPEFWAGPLDQQIDGVGEKTIAHGLPAAPDFVAAFPYAAGGITEPAGVPIMTTLPDADNLYFGNAAAAPGGDMILRCYATAVHSIQA